MSDSPADSFTGQCMDALRAHPVISALMLLFTLAGAVAGGIWLREDWSLVHRLLAGASAGFGCGLLITLTRMLGAFGGSD